MSMEEKGSEKKWECPPHWWKIDEKNVGRCKYCPAVKDFSRKLKEELAKGG